MVLSGGARNVVMLARMMLKKALHWHHLSRIETNLTQSRYYRLRIIHETSLKKAGEKCGDIEISVINIIKAPNI